MDLVTAAVRTLADRFRDPLPASLAPFSESVGSLCQNIAEGWERLETELAYPTLVIDAPTPAERALHAPIVLALDAVVGDAAKVDVTFGVAGVTIPLNLEVFASSPTQRSKVVEAALATFAGGLVDDDAQLEIASEHYRDRMIGFRVSGVPRWSDFAGRIRADEWRGIIPVEADVEEIVVARVPRLRELRVGMQLASSAEAFGPIEYRTIFAP